MKNNELANLKINSDLLKTCTHPNRHQSVNFSNYKHSFKVYLNRFFNKKINYLWAVLFFLFFIFIISCVIFYKYSPIEPVCDSMLAANLPNYKNRVIMRKFSPDDPLLKLILNEHSLNKSLGIIKSFQKTNESTFLEHDPYALLESITGQKIKHYFGTNIYKTDRFSFFSHSIGYSILISISAIILQWTLGSYLGSLTGYHSEKTGSKIGFHLVNIINVLPFLIICIFVFKLIGYTHFLAIITLGVFGSVSFFYTSYSNALEIKTREYIQAYKSSGMSDNWIIFHIAFVENLWVNLALFGENLSLNMLVLSSLAFFNIKSIENYLNIGNVFKDIINDLSNMSYVIYVTLVTTFFILISKIFSIKLYKASVANLV